MGESELTLLLTNDDGYRARGISVLADYLEGIADVRMIAPKGNRSGVGHSVTFGEKLVVEERNYNGRDIHVTSGMPADCTNFGLETLFPDEIDIVVSGINQGRNLGNDIYVSGTVAGARAAAFSPHDMVGIAVSAASDSDHECNFELAAEFCRDFTEWVYGNLQVQPELFKNIYFNLNAPAADDIKGIALTYSSLDRGATGWYEQVKHRGKKTKYKRRWKRPEDTTEIGSDIWATQKDYLSITILSLDSCAHTELEELLMEEFTFREYSLEAF